MEETSNWCEELNELVYSLVQWLVMQREYTEALILMV
jgi:hypothetical protein